MEFQINGITYTAGKLNAVAQFHIVRRMLPVFSSLAGSSGAVKKAQTADEQEGAVFGEVLPKIFDVLAAMKDDDFEYVLFGLLSCVKRREAGGCGWSAVTTTDKHLMFDDLNMAALTQLAVKAFTANLSDFFQGLPLDLKEAAQKQSGL